jgi:hypothetical protein
MFKHHVVQVQEGLWEILNLSIERRERVISIPSYFEHPGFKSRPRHRLLL